MLGGLQTFRQTQALRDIITKLQDELSSTQAALEESKGEVAELLATAAGKERALVKVRVLCVQATSLAQPCTGCAEGPGSRLGHISDVSHGC